MSEQGSSAHADGSVRAALTAAPLLRVRKFLRLVAIEHSVFALPFAYLSALTAMFSLTRTVNWWQLFLITVAMVSARTFTMAVNRIADREIDARNPRTAGRELVTGEMSVRSAVTGALVALAVFLAAAALLSSLCLALAPLAALPLFIYPYAKRFTWAPHAFLGLAQAVAPVAAWIAVTNSLTWSAGLLGAAVGSWIGGFDIIYSCQDVDPDRRQGIGSLPARFGIAPALVVARATHAVTTGLFVGFGLLEHFGPVWWLGLAATAAAFVYEHSLVKANDLSKLNRAFFTVNGFVGIGLFAAALLDLVLRGLGGSGIALGG